MNDRKLELITRRLDWADASALVALRREALEAERHSTFLSRLTIYETKLKKGAHRMY